MPQLPTGTVAFLFTDIEGSTRLLQRLGPDYARVLREHQALLRAAFAAHDGAEVDTQGDALFVAFPTALDAVSAAAEATRALAEHAWPEDATVRVRMGLHTGTPQLVGDHYVGLDVHRAARIAAAGHGGQVLLSEATRGLVQHQVPVGATLRDVGSHRLKDLQHAEHLYQLVLPGLPTDFPPLKTLDAHPHNLPIQPTPLLGREEPVAAVAALLRREAVRLVTLTGPGGIGKTRISIQVAAELVEDFADGVWFVRLSRLTDPTLVVPTIAQTLSLKEAGSQPIAETLREYLRARRLLLVLDNFEQVVAAAPEVGGLLESCPGLRVLATSRIPLRLRGEKAYAVSPLPLAGPEEAQAPERLAQYAAVALFIERACDARADFRVSAANAPAIAAICTRLDGLPLAIELAAAKVTLLPPPALLTRLERQLPVLTDGARDLEERQQTMRSTLAWSENLLHPEEQRLFRRLVVFVGGCTLEAAEAVCVMPEGMEPLALDILAGLGALVDQGLVQQREEGGEARFSMLHVIREYALERLEASTSGSEAEALRRAHLAYYLGMAEGRETAVYGPEAETWLRQFEREHDNLLAALACAREQDEAGLGLRLAGALLHTWEAGGYYTEGRGWLEELLASAGSDILAATRAKALCGVGVFAYRQGDDDQAIEALKESLELARGQQPGWVAGMAVHVVGLLALRRGDQGQAEGYVEESVARMQVAGELGLAAAFILEMGSIAWDRDDLERAAAYYEEGLVLARRAGAALAAGDALGNLANVARRQGDLVRAEMVGREMLMVLRSLSVRGYLTVSGLEGLAHTAAAASDGAGRTGGTPPGSSSGLARAGGRTTPPVASERHGAGGGAGAGSSGRGGMGGGVRGRAGAHA